MLRKKERLTKASFGLFFKSGKRVHSPFLTLVYTPHHTFHASIVVPKKVAHGAVKRNKIRRQLYDIVRKQRDVTSQQGIFIFLVKNPSINANFQILKREVEGLITKARSVS
jgi:ribonuclease P protein component